MSKRPTFRGAWTGILFFKVEDWFLFQMLRNQYDARLVESIFSEIL